MYATGMRNGTSLAEVMVAVLIMVIVIIGSSILFVAGRSQISMQERNRVATELAAQKLEELKAGSYSDIVEGDTEETVAMEDLSYDRQVQTVDLGMHKQVTATVNWQHAGTTRTVSLVTLIGPK